MVIPEKAFNAYYLLDNPHSQITSYVFDVVRSTIPKLTLDETFLAKDDVAHAVRDQLKDVMEKYGYMITKALVVDLNPDNKVKAAMNDINAQKRLKEATLEKAEGEKIILVKAAEADAESKYLSGLGVARQRHAIVSGLKESVTGFAEEVSGATPKDVMDILLLTQYFDMLRDVGQHGSGKTLFMNHGPGTVTELQGNMRSSLMKSMINTKA